MAQLGLKEETIKHIQAVFAKYAEIEKVLVYGSRAMGNHQPASDIDLTLIGKDIDLRVQSKMEFELDDLMLPYKFDISIFSKITNPDLIGHINRVGKVLYARDNEGVTL